MKKEFHFFKFHYFTLFLLAALLITNLTTFFVPRAFAQLKARLWNGEEVEVMLGCEISTDTLKVGTQFRTKVKEDVGKGEDIYIYKGDPVFATVESVRKPGWYGRGAELVIRFDSTMSTGGTFIPLKGQLQKKGKGRKTFAYVLFFIGWAIKGKNVQLTPEETKVTVVNAPDPPGYIDIEFRP